MGGFTYQVKAEPHDVKYLNSVNAWAELCTQDQSIIIDSSATEERQKSAFLHELIHLAAKDSYYLGDDPAVEEEMAKRVGLSLFMIFKDNPKILEYLLHG